MVPLSLLGVLAVIAWQAHASAVYTFTDMNVTYYYDNNLAVDGDVCAANSGGAGWTTAVNAGSTACGVSVGALDTNRVVAMAIHFIDMDRAALCGREVQIWQGDTQYTIDEGPFFLWEACDACDSLPRVDMSVKGYVAVTGDGECFDGTEGGYTVMVMDDFVLTSGATSIFPSMTSVPDSDAGLTPTTIASFTGGAGVGEGVSASSTPTPTPTPSAAAVTTLEAATSPLQSPTPSSATTSSCTLPSWQCAGSQLQVCNYIDGATATTAWVLADDCESGCGIVGGITNCL